MQPLNKGPQYDPRSTEKREKKIINVYDIQINDLRILFAEKRVLMEKFSGWLAPKL